MSVQNSPEDFLNLLIKDINNDITALYSNSSVNRRTLLDHLKDRMMVLENFIKLMMKTGQPPVSDRNHYEAVMAAETTSYDDPQTFTIDQLAQFDGKNGKPGYVAIGNVVYDITNNPSWAGASHFGISAGHDVTTEFSTCHKGRSALTSLPVVGNLVK